MFFDPKLSWENLITSCSINAFKVQGVDFECVGDNCSIVRKSLQDGESKSDLSTAQTAWYADGAEQDGVMTCTRRLGILWGRCASTMERGRLQSSQSAAAAMWALLRGCSVVVVLSTSGTSGWRPRLRMTASTGGRRATLAARLA
jgi:hypothetical protein